LEHKRGADIRKGGESVFERSARLPGTVLGVFLAVLGLVWEA
jgi:hypothetical protein